MTDENYLRQFKKRRRTLADWLLRRAQTEEKSAQRFWQTFDALNRQTAANEDAAK